MRVSEGGFFLEMEVSGYLAEALQIGEVWHLEYNSLRPHNALGYQTPADVAWRAARLAPPRCATLAPSEP